jgi:hypothetical protein
VHTNVNVYEVNVVGGGCQKLRTLAHSISVISANLVNKFRSFLNPTCSLPYLLSLYPVTIFRVLPPYPTIKVRLSIFFKNLYLHSKNRLGGMSPNKGPFSGLNW